MLRRMLALFLAALLALTLCACGAGPAGEAEDVVPAYYTTQYFPLPAETLPRLACIQNGRVYYTAEGEGDPFALLYSCGPAWAEALFTWDDGGNVYLLDNGRILAAGPQGEDRGVLSENARFLFRGKDGRALAVIAPAYGDWRVRAINGQTLGMQDMCTIPPAALSAWDVTFSPGRGRMTSMPSPTFPSTAIGWTGGAAASSSPGPTAMWRRRPSWRWKPWTGDFSASPAARCSAARPCV